MSNNCGQITRREFTKTLSQIGLGASALAMVAYGNGAQGKGTSDQMKQRKLGRTDLKVLPLGFGAQHTRDADLIHGALDQGVNLIETAWAYGFGKPGNSCECIGKAIAGSLRELRSKQ